jgi:hypothetical protein
MRFRIGLILVSVLLSLGLLASPASSSVRRGGDLPNLTLSSWGFGYNCTSFGSVGASIINTGTATSPPFSVLVTLAGRKAHMSTLEWTSELAPGDTATLGPTGYAHVRLRPGVTYLFTIEVDWQHLIEESSESDNIGTNEIQC